VTGKTTPRAFLELRRNPDFLFGFDSFLTSQAMCGPGDSLQTFGPDGFATGNALSEIALINPVKGGFHHAKQPAVVFTQTEKKLLQIVFIGSVGGIG
jgi:hypothetical protein